MLEKHLCTISGVCFSFQVNKCMKSLASEVAAKHDEVCQLQSQLVALDEVVQTARQKLILKDKCIAQLNQQVRGDRDQNIFNRLVLDL